MRIKGYDGDLPQPLTDNAIPANQMLHSPRAGNAHGTPRPIYPGEAGFEEALYEVIETRAKVVHMEWPTQYLTSKHPVPGMGDDVPFLLNHMQIGRGNPETCAQVVAMDKPSDLGLELWNRVIQAGGKLKDKYKAKNGNTPFVEAFARFNAELGFACYVALDKIFDVKYHWMLERPETVKNIPGCIFTGDRYGAPNHPAYGAGHGAVAGITLELIKRFFNLAGDLLNMVIDACYQFAHWRTLLGVHYRADNDLGMEVGASVIDNVPAIS